MTTRVRSLVGFALASALFACGPAAPSGPLAPAPHDPAPLAKCRVAASSASPLVTEWPASEKAHLQSLAAGQPVAVAYSGCELRIVDACKLTGRYAWRRTTLASDTVEITTGDELWAKLPLGAVSLEGELERSGRLAVRTTVAGQLALEGLDQRTATDPSCAAVTHVVAGIAVGAFGLMSGGASSTRGGASALNVGAGASTKREEQIVRQAGDPRACGEATESAPHAQCGAPIQLFLQPFASAPATPAAAAAQSDEARARQTGIQITFPASPVAGEHWTLREPSGTVACELPCTKWVGPGSGYFLERSGANGNDVTHLDVPVRFPHAPGSHVTASYQAERGSPFLSKLTFWGMGVPTGATGVGLIIAGAAGAGDRNGDHTVSTFFITSGVLFLATAGAATWWYLWSHPASLETHQSNAASVRFGPGFAYGTF